MSTFNVRTLFHFIYMNLKGNEFWVRIPAWDSNLAVRVTSEQMTPEVCAAATVGMRCYGQVNLKAETYHDLAININELSSRRQWDDDGFGEKWTKHLTGEESCETI